MPEEANEEQRVCCCAAGDCTKELIRLQIVGCLYRIGFWIYAMVLMSAGIYMIDHDIKFLPDEYIKAIPDCIYKVRCSCIIALSAAIFLIVMYIFGIVLGAIFFRNASNNLENVRHSRAWHVYATVSLSLGLIFDLFLVFHSNKFYIIPFIVTIFLNAYTIRAMKMLRERLRRKNALELTARITEENL